MKIKSKSFLLLILVILISPGLVSAHPQSEKPEASWKKQSRQYSQANEAIDRLSDDWIKYYNKGDFKKLATLYDDDAWVMTRHQPARRGVNEIIDYFKRTRVQGAEVSMVFDLEERQFDGDYVFQTSKWWLTVTKPDGDVYKDSGRSFVVFVKGFDDRWRIWRDIDNHTPDVPETYEPRGIWE